MHQRACNSNHYFGDIVTTEHLLGNHHKSIISLKCSCSDSLIDVVRVVSCKVAMVWAQVSYANNL